MVIQAKTISLFSSNLGCSDCSDSRGQQWSTLNSHSDLHLCTVYHFSFSPSLRHEAHWELWELAMLSVSLQMGLYYHNHGCLLVRWISHRILNGTWQGNERAVFGYSSSEALSLLCNNKSSWKSTSYWTRAVTLSNSYIQFPSTSHTCVQGPCLHQRWLTNDMDSQLPWWT